MRLDAALAQAPPHVQKDAALAQAKQMLLALQARHDKLAELTAAQARELRAVLGSGGPPAARGPGGDAAGQRVPGCAEAKAQPVGTAAAVAAAAVAADKEATRTPGTLPWLRGALRAAGVQSGQELFRRMTAGRRILFSPEASLEGLSVSCEEFSEGILALGVACSARHARLLFDALDARGRGRLGERELARVLPAARAKSKKKPQKPKQETAEAGVAAGGACPAR